MGPIGRSQVGLEVGAGNWIARITRGPRPWSQAGWLWRVVAPMRPQSSFSELRWFLQDLRGPDVGAIPRGRGVGIARTFSLQELVQRSLRSLCLGFALRALVCLPWGRLFVSS